MDFNSNKKNSGKQKSNKPIITDIHSLDNNRLDNVPIGFFFGIVSSRYVTFFDSFFTDLNLNHNKFWILLTLCYKPNISQEQISSILNINKATVTREVKYLEKKELIIRKTDANDKRRNIVSLSEKGFKMFEIFKEVDYESELELLNSLSRDEIYILKFLLKKVIITIEDIHK